MSGISIPDSYLFYTLTKWMGVSAVQWCLTIGRIPWIYKLQLLDKKKICQLWTIARLSHIYDTFVAATNYSLPTRIEIDHFFSIYIFFQLQISFAWSISYLRSALPYIWRDLKRLIGYFNRKFAFTIASQPTQVSNKVRWLIWQIKYNTLMWNACSDVIRRITWKVLIQVKLVLVC